MSRTARRVVVLAALVVAVLSAALASLFIGAADTSGIIITQIRAPRVVLAVVVGAGLGVSGALLQGSLRNPLADPGIVGVSAGAALGAVAGAAIGFAYGGVVTAVTALVGGLIAMAAVTWIARSRGQTEVVTLILGGVAITAFASAIVTVIVAGSADAGSRSAGFWTTGSLALATWPGVAVTAPFVVVALVAAIALGRSLDVLSLGDRAAWTAGIPVDRIRAAALAAAVIAVAAGVSVIGVVVFVGLVVPHAIRLLIGPGHRPLVIGSALGGALLLLIADTVARSVVAPVELPLGVVTAAIGAPLFVLLIVRTRAEQGGWA